MADFGEKYLFTDEAMLHHFTAPMVWTRWFNGPLRLDLIAVGGAMRCCTGISRTRGVEREIPAGGRLGVWIAEKESIWICGPEGSERRTPFAARWDRAPIPAAPDRICGCGKHPCGDDPYASHQKWLAGELLKGPFRDSVVENVHSQRMLVRVDGIGVSAEPKLGPVLVEIQHADFI